MEGRYSRYILRSAACACGLYLGTGQHVQADEYQIAVRKAAHAYYKYSDLDDYFRELERRHVPREVKKYGGTIAAVTTLVIEKRITMKWTFK
jgi:predicted nucleic acid-binding Zn finger protein